MREGYDGAERAIGTYFEDIVYDIKDHSLSVARPSNVIDETNRKEDSLGAAIGSFVSSLGGDAFDDFVMSAARSTVDDVAADVIQDQRDIVFEATQLKAGDTLDEEQYEQKKREFADRADDWVEDLNPEARNELNRAMRAGFDTVTDNLSYFVEQYERSDEVQGETFEEILGSMPRDETEDRLYSLVDYVTELKEAFEMCDEVYSAQDSPVAADRVHFRQEATRVLDEVETYVEQEIEHTIEQAYGDAA
ncbi:MAG: hypothetical protein SVU32_09250 [Candidatus Nanohaloarchaea archaeon]|nr:hypothetical protein [Candidatus Nanohaloarchaea archaeon]